MVLSCAVADSRTRNLEFARNRTTHDPEAAGLTAVSMPKHVNGRAWCRNSSVLWSIPLVLDEMQQMGTRASLSAEAGQACKDRPL
jgi:hypothetical protein